MSDIAELLAELQEETVRALIESIKNGDLDPRMLKEAREFLKDNDIKSEPEHDEQLSKLEGAFMEIDGQHVPEGLKVVAG